MIRILLTSLLLLNSVFWGFFPINERSPQRKILNKLNINYSETKNRLVNLCLGLFFYLFAFLINHIDRI